MESEKPVINTPVHVAAPVVVPVVVPVPVAAPVPVVVPVSIVVATNKPNGRTAMPINLLNNYQNNWRIEGRVSQKAPMKTYRNAKGDGQLFDFILCDETCDIKIAAFNNQATKFFDIIQVGKVYSIAKGSLKTANRRFNNTKSEYEISLSGETDIIELNDVEVELPEMTFDFVTIDKMVDLQLESFVGEWEIDSDWLIGLLVRCRWSGAFDQ